MIRRVIEIDREKCNGCGACAAACHEGAIGMVDGKAQLMRDDYCDGFGDCLPACPTGAIQFIEREAADYNAAAVAANKQAKQTAAQTQKLDRTPEQNQPNPTPEHTHEHIHEHMHGGGCPGSRMRQLSPRPVEECSTTAKRTSMLGQWPCQIKLVPVNAPYFNGAKLLIAADCTAYAYAALHEEFMAGKITLIGCPKLDNVDYTEKLTEILQANDIKSLTIVRMEVPCCGGLERAATNALQSSGKFIPWRVATISIDGRLLDD